MGHNSFQSYLSSSNYLEDLRDINAAFHLGMNLIILISSDILICIKCFSKISWNRPSKKELKETLLWRGLLLSFVAI